MTSIREVVIFAVFALTVLGIATLYEDKCPAAPHIKPPPPPTKYQRLSVALKKAREARIFYSIGNAAFTMADVKWGCPEGYTLHRLGPLFEGGKSACLANETLRDCLIYSWGSNGDFGFEEAIHALKPECEIHTFDCTVLPTNTPSFVHYHHQCLGSSSGTSYFQLLQQLNHTTKQPLIVKMDIEGWEWPFFSEYFTDSRIPRMQQIIVEVHLRVSKMALPERYQSLDNFAPEVADDRGRRVIPFFHMLLDWDKEFDIVTKEHNTDKSPPAPGGKVGCETCAEFTLMAR